MAVDLGALRRRCDRILADDHSADDVSWLLGAGRHLARQARDLAEETAVLRELVDGLESRLAGCEADRLSAVASSERRGRELSSLRVALLTVELYARKART